MQLLLYLSIFALSLGAACSNDSRKKEVPVEDSPVEDSVQASDTLNSASVSPNQQAEAGEADTLYLISGTEPFWSLAIARPRSVYTSADGDTLYFDFKEARTASARQEEHVQVFELGREQQLVLRKTATDCPCSDGMSSKAYPYQATLILAEKILDGCGRKSEAGN